MNIEDLKGKVERYEESVEKVKQNRKYWQESTKPLLIQTLKEIKTSYPIGWDVQVLDWTTNSEGVNITFGNMPSGITQKSEKSFRHFIKNGGTIVFSQSGNGNIFIIIRYPSIEEFVSEKEHKLLEMVSPDQITREFIIKKVSVFLEEMTKWEKSNEEIPLGYLRK